MKIHISHLAKKNLTTHEIVELIIKNRNIFDVEKFLSPPHPKNLSLSDFFPHTHFQKHSKLTLKALKKALNHKQKVIIWGDYDADGITGTAILWQTLHRLGFDVWPHIPARESGYGFNITDIQNLHSSHSPALIITVDHGIAGHDGVDFSGSLGIPVIITDHHSKAETDPDALAIFHTDKISGSGVAYLFAKYIFEEIAPENNQLKQLFETDFLALATIGIVADLIPLTGAARDICFHGLAAFTRIIQPGLIELAKSCQLDGQKPTTYDIGFKIAPRINALGRIADATDALRLLCTTSTQKAKDLTKIANETNTERQNIVEKSLKKALSHFDSLSEVPNFILYRDDELMEGIIGLIASKLTQKFHLPSLVITCANGKCKGSARSVKAINITEFLKTHSQLFTSVGGHHQAAGCSLLESDLATLADALTKDSADFDKNWLIPSLEVDMEIPLNLITLDLAQSLENLAPFGIGNPKPTFLSEGKFTLIKPTKNPSVWQFTFSDGINFFSGVDFSQSISEQAINYESKIIFRVQFDKFNGKNSAKIELIKVINDEDELIVSTKSNS